MEHTPTTPSDAPQNSSLDQPEPGAAQQSDTSNQGFDSYTLEQLSVKNPGQGQPTQPQTSVFGQDRSTRSDSKRKALIISTLITLVVLLITLGSLFVFSTSTNKQDELAQSTPEHDISLGGQFEQISIPGVEEDSDSLLINGDLVTRGVIKLSQNGFVASLDAGGVNDDRTYQLPDDSGTFCLDTNNCNFITSEDFAALQAQVGQIVVPDVPDGTSINGFTNSVTVAGTPNQINVVSANGLITLSTPQNIAPTSSPTFNNQTLTGNLNVGGTLQLGLDCTTFLGGGALTTNASGQIVCSDDDDSGGTGFVTSLNGLTNVVDIVDAGSGLISVTVNGQNIELSIQNDSIGDAQLAFNTGQNLTALSSPTFSGLSLSQLSLGGDTVTDLTGNGLQVVANALTLSLEANKGLEVDGNGLSLVDCGDGQVLKYETTGNTWGCATDADTGGAPTDANYIVFGALDPALTDERQLTFGSNLQFVDGGANGTLAVSVVNNPTFSGLVTANGGIAFGAGQALTINGDSFTDLTGTGLQVVGNVLQTVLGTSIDSGEIVDGTIQAVDFESTNIAGPGTDNYVLTYDDITGGFTWVDPAVAGGPRVDSLNTLTGDLSIVGTAGQIIITPSGGDTFTFSLDTAVSLLGQSIGLSELEANSVDSSKIVDGSVSNTDLANSSLTVTAGSGLINGGSVSLGGATTLDINTGNGLTIITDAVTLALQANKGLEVDANGLSLIDCANNQILKYETTGNTWACNTDTDTDTTYTAGNDLNLVGTTFNLDAVLNTVTDIIRDSGNLTLQTTTSGNIVLDSAGTIDLLDQTNIQGQLYLGTDSGLNGALSFYNSTNSNTVTLQSGVTGASYALTLPTGLGSVNQCLKAQDGTGTLFWDDCTGGSGGGLSGSGTTNRIARFTPDGTTIGDSSLTDDGTNATATGDFAIQGGDLTLGQATGSTGSIVFHDNDGVGGQTVTLTAPDVTTSYGLTLPTAAGSNTECLRVDGTGQLYFDACSGGGSGSGVDSLRSLTGTLNLQGTANEIEVTDNTTDTITIGLPSDVIIGNTLTVTGLATLNGGLTVQNGDTFTFGGNAYTSLTGTGLQFNAGSLEAVLGTTIDSSEIVDGTVANIDLANSSLTVTAGAGLINGGSVSLGGATTLDINTGNGLTVVTDAVTLALQANKGLEVDGNGLSLVDCADGQVLKYETTGNTWGCAADAGGTGVGDDVQVNGANADGANFLNSIASATSAATTWNLNTASTPDEITLTIGAASGTEAGIVTANAQAFGGEKTFNAEIQAAGGIDLAAQTLFGTTAVIDFTNFDLAGNGDITTAGDLALNGGDLTSTGALNITPGGALAVGSTSQTALLQGSTTTITSTGVGNDITLNSADALILTATGNITLTGFDCTLNTNGGKLTTDASGNVSCQDDVDTDTDTTYTAGNDLNLVGTTFNLDSTLNFVTDVIRDSGNLTLQTTTSGNIVLNSVGTVELQSDTNVTGNLTATGNGTFEGGTVNVGVASTTTGNLNLYNAASAFAGTLQVAALGQASTYILPDPVAASDTICLQGLGNCSGAGASSVGTIDSQAKSADGAVISSNTLYLQTADDLFPGLVSTGSQTFAGDKTFNGSVTLAATQTLTITGDATAFRPAGTEGELYYDTDTNQLLVYSNGKWQADRTTATKIVAANNSPQAVKDGADYVADGTADQTEINAAITAAAGGTVYLAEGTYNITATINMADNTTLTGAGQGATTLFIPNATDVAFAVLTLNSTNNFTLRDFTVDGNQANQTTKNRFGISIQSSTGGPGLIENVTSKNNGEVGIRVANANDITINNVAVEANLDYGIYLVGGTGHTISNTRSMANGTGSLSDAGIFISGGVTNSIVANNYLEADNTDTLVGGSLYITGDNNSITGNTIISPTGIAIMDNASGNSYTGNSIRTPGDSGFLLAGNNTTISGNNIYDAGDHAISFSGGVTDVTITGNTIFYETTNPATANGINIPSVSRFLVSGNTITNAGSNGIATGTGATEGTISNNRIHNSGVNSAGSDGIDISSFSVAPIQIVGNHVTDTAGSGFAIDIGETGIYLADNIYSGTGASSIDAVAGTIYGGQVNDTGNYVIQPAGEIDLNAVTNVTSGTLNVGEASTTTGSINLYNAGSAFAGTIQVAALGQATTYTIPDAGGATGTFCILEAANCSGGAANLQDAYVGGNTITATDTEGSIAFTLSEATNFTTDITGTGSFIVQDSGVNVFEIADGGQSTFSGNVTIASTYELKLEGDTTLNRPTCDAGAAGTLYYDTDTDQLLQCNGGKWQGDRTTATKIVAANNSPQAVKDSADYLADGTADQTEINAAITAAAGGTVYLAEGTYNITATINMADNTTLTGAGQGATTLFIPNATDVAFAVLTLNSTNNFTLRDFTVDGNQANQTTKNTRGIHITSSGGPGLIENVTSKNNGGSGIEAGSADDITINNVTVEGNLDRGIYLSSGTGNTISNSRSISNSDGAGSSDAGFYINSNNTIITSNHLESDNSYVVTGSLYVTGDRNTVTNNNIVNAQNNALTVGSVAKNTTVTGNVISEPVEEGIRVDGTNTIVSSNSIYNPGSFAINIGTGGDNATITGNDVFYETTNTTTDSAIILANGVGQFLVNGNTITNAGANGIATLLSAGPGVISNNRIENSGVNASSSDGIDVSGFATLPIKVTNNHITDTAGTGFAIDIGVAGVYLADNTYSGTGASSIDAVAGTIYGGQVNATGDYIIQPAGNIELVADTNVTGNLDVSGDMALGAGAAINTGPSLGFAATYDNVLALQQTFTDMTSTDIVGGITNYIILDPAAPATSLAIGSHTNVEVASGNSNDIGQIYGSLTGIDVQGSGTIGAAVASHNSVQHQGAGTLGSAIGGIFDVSTNGVGTINVAAGIQVMNFSGTINNSVGIFIDEQSSGSTSNANLALGTTPGSGNYSLYSDSNYDSYFATNVGIGDSSPAHLLTVGNGDLFGVNTSGNVIVTALGSADTDTVVCRNASNQLATCNSAFASQAYVTLQNAYTNNNTITASDAEGDVAITLTEATNFTTNITGSGSFEVQSSAVDVFSVDASGATRINTTLTADVASAKLYVVGNSQFEGVLRVGDDTNYIETDGSNRLRYVGTSRNDKTVTSVPEFVGAILRGSGTGYMTADFCSGSGLRNTNIAVCTVSTEEHNYYEWTTSEATAQTYDVYMRYQIPSDFDDDETGTWTFNGWATDASSNVTVSIYDWDDTTTPCVSGADIATGTAAWSSVPPSVASCDFNADDEVLLVFSMTADQNDFARLGEFILTYKSVF